MGTTVQAYEQRDDIQARLVALQDRAAKETAQFDNEIKELNRALDHDRQLKAFMGVKSQDRGKVGAWVLGWLFYFIYFTFLCIKKLKRKIKVFIDMVFLYKGCGGSTGSIDSAARGRGQRSHAGRNAAHL